MRGVPGMAAPTLGLFNLPCSVLYPVRRVRRPASGRSQPFRALGEAAAGADGFHGDRQRLLRFLIVAPLTRLLVSSFKHRKGTGSTFANYVTAWADLKNLNAVGNSIRDAIEGTIPSAAFAVPIACDVSRTDMPAKNLIQTLIIGAFIRPPDLGGVGWILLGGPNAGCLNRAWMGLAGSNHGFVNVYTRYGMALVTPLHAFPYIFVFTSAALGLLSLVASIIIVLIGNKLTGRDLTLRSSS